MPGQAGRHMYRSRDKQTDRRAGKQTDKQTDRQISRQTDKQTDRQAGRQTVMPGNQAGRYRSADGQTNRQTDRQTDRQTGRQGLAPRQTETNLASVREFRGRLLIALVNSCGCEKIHVHQFNVHAV